MSSQPNTQFHSDLDSSPLLLPAKVLRTDAEALQAARELAAITREQASRRDQQRKLPWAEIEQFTERGHPCADHGHPSHAASSSLLAIPSGRKP